MQTREINVGDVGPEILQDFNDNMKHYTGGKEFNVIAWLPGERIEIKSKGVVVKLDLSGEKLTLSVHVPIYIPVPGLQKVIITSLEDTIRDKFKLEEEEEEK